MMMMITIIIIIIIIILIIIIIRSARRGPRRAPFEALAAAAVANDGSEEARCAADREREREREREKARCTADMSKVGCRRFAAIRVTDCFSVCCRRFSASRRIRDSNGPVNVLFGLTEKGQTGSRSGDTVVLFLHIFDQ